MSTIPVLNRKKRHFNCTDCPFETTRAREFFYHKRDIHGNTAKIFECHLCPFASVYGKKLDRHMALHKMNAEDEDETDSPKCTSSLRIVEPNSSSAADSSARPKVKPLTLKRLNVKMPFKISKMKKKLKLMKDAVHFKTKGKRVLVKSNSESQKEVYRMIPQADGTYQYQCVDCLYYSAIPSSVKKHHLLCHCRLLCCPHCNMTTRSQGIHYEHLVTHEGHGYIKCPDCSYVTGVRSNFEKHRSFHTESYPMKCSVCNFGAESECKIKRHVATQHMPEIVPDQSPPEAPVASVDVTMNETVNTESWETGPTMESSAMQQEDRDEHVQTSSSRDDKSTTGEEFYEYRCPKCPMICYRRGNFTRHLTAKHKFNQSSASMLSKNMEAQIMKVFKKSPAPVKSKSKKGFSNEMHKCPHCSYIAKWPSDLRRHMQVHTIVKRFKCSMCTNKYKYIGDLNVHMRRDHNMEPPETVAREFTHLSVIKKASPAMFRCPICPYVSHSKADLEQHSRNHGNTDKTYQCRMCEYQTYWRGDVGRHLFRHHKIILSKEGEELVEHFIFRPEIKPLTKQGSSGCLKPPSLSPSPEPGKSNPESLQDNKDFIKEGTPDSSKSSASSVKTTSGKASSKEGVLYCEHPNCDFKAGLADRMAQHMAVHLNLKQFVCPTCGKRTNYKWDIVKHMNTVHANPAAGVEDVITLSIEEARATIDDYMSGMGKKGKKATLNFCSLCDFKSWERQHVVKHIEAVHSNEEGTVLNRPQGGETSQDYSHLDEAELVGVMDISNESVEVHKFVEPLPEELAKYEKPYACAICKKKGSTKGDVKKHYNYTHPYKDVRILYVGDGTEFNYYTGEIYSKTLKIDTPGEMTDSRPSTPSSVSPSAKTLRPDSKFSNPKVHGYVKPFKCSICGLRSNWKWDLKKHLRSKHSGEGGFVIMLSIEEASSTYGKDCSPSHPKHDAYLSIPKTGSSPVPDQYLFKQPLNIKAEILPDCNDEGGQMMDPATLEAMDDVEMSDSMRKCWRCSGCKYETNQGKKIVQHINKDHALEKETIRAILVSRAEGDDQPKEWMADGSSISHSSNLMNVSTNVHSEEKSQLWDCPACPFKSQDKTLIVSHMQQHSMKPYICKVCNLAFRKKSVLHKHIYKKHKTNDYSKLIKLNISYASQQAVRQTGKYVSSYHCQLCNAESEDKATIFLHLQEVHGLSDTENILKIHKYVAESPEVFPKVNRKLHFCRLCPYRSQKKSMLTFHMTYHKPNPANKFKCKHCPYYVSTKRLLHQHQRKWHKDFNKLTWEHEEQTPTTTPQSSPHKPHMGHFVTAGMHRRHFCEKCPYMTNSKNDFIYHKQFHRARRTAEFKCEYCDYWVVHKRLLKQHMRLHTDKNFDCNGLSDSSPAKSLYSDPGLVYDPIELTELAAIKQKMISAKITSSLPKSVSADSCEAEASPDVSEDNAKFVFKNGFYRKLNKCRYCPYTNTKMRNMQLHEMMHGPRNSEHNLLKCPLCDYYVGSKGLLSHHMKVHQINYNENLSDGAENGGMAEDMYSPPKMDTLLQITRFKRFGCERCPYASAKRQHFERHLELHGSRQRYTCQYCDYSVPSSNLLLQHTKLHLMPNQNLLSSQSITNLQHLTEVPADVALASALPPTDTETTVTVSVVHDHLGLYENSIYDSEPKKLYRCDRCPYANIRRDFLLSHLKFHIVPSAMNCPYCDYSAPKQPLLSQHIRVHFCPLPELSDWLLENGQTERETIQRHIDLAEALKVAQEYQNQCRNKDKAKTTTTNKEEEKTIKPMESEGKENVEAISAGAHICQYCDREFVTPEKLVKHELQHLIGNQFEVTANLLMNEPACPSEVCPEGRKQVSRKQSTRREKARKKKNFHKSQKPTAGSAVTTDVVGCGVNSLCKEEVDHKDGSITTTLTNSHNTDGLDAISSRENEPCVSNDNSPSEECDRKGQDSSSEAIVHNGTNSPASITETNAAQLRGDVKDKQVQEDLEKRSSDDHENDKGLVIEEIKNEQQLVNQDIDMENSLISEELKNAEKSVDVCSTGKSLEETVPEKQLGDSGHEEMVVDSSMNTEACVGNDDHESSTNKSMEAQDKEVPTHDDN